MVNGFALDYMHLICLGTVRKLLYLWCFDTKSGSKLSRQNLNMVSRLLVAQSVNIPCNSQENQGFLLRSDDGKQPNFVNFYYTQDQLF